jgi:hypothetical protein
MVDLLYLGLILGLALATIGLIIACERLRSGGE